MALFYNLCQRDGVTHIIKRAFVPPIIVIKRRISEHERQAMDVV